MVCRALFGILACLMASGAESALALDCPTLDYEKIEKLVTDAPSCDASLQWLMACQLGSSGDVGLSQIVIKKCEAGFLASLSKSARRGYERKVGACGRRFAGQSGTLYQSIRAICAAELAHSYASKAAKTEK